MKGRVISTKSLSGKFQRKNAIEYSGKIPIRSIKMDIKELLARMWIKCDPNRGDTNPDDIINREGSSYDGKPEWTWFVPRAEATLQFLDDAGYKIVKK